MQCGVAWQCNVPEEKVAKTLAPEPLWRKADAETVTPKHRRRNLRAAEVQVAICTLGKMYARLGQDTYQHSSAASHFHRWWYYRWCASKPTSLGQKYQFFFLIHL